MASPLLAGEVAELRRMRRPSMGALWARLALAAGGLLAVVWIVGWLS